MYKALYRKWRPLTFDDVVGQEHITETLKSQVKNDRLSHAYLFVGTRGTGKTTCAKILARAVNCESPRGGNPCNECPSCLGILDGSVMDVEEMDAASNNGVDNVRALRDEAVFSPASVKKRVYIVDEVHMLSSSAFNALLKILEEPPEHLMFILATTELHKVPATILSRCQRYSFRRIDGETIARHLSEVSANEGIRLQPGAAEILARLSEGSMRDAISLLDQCAGREDITADDVLTAMGLAGGGRTAELLQFIAGRDTEAAIHCFTKLWMDGKEPATLLDELSRLCRDILICKIAPKSGGELVTGGYAMPLLRELGEKLGSETLLNFLGTIQKAQGDIKTSPNPRVTAEMCIITLCAAGAFTLEDRVRRLEAVLQGGVPPIKTQAPPPLRPAKRPEVAPQPVPQPKAERTEDAPPWDPEAEAPPPAEEAPVAESEPTLEPAGESVFVPTGELDGALWPDILAHLKKNMPIGAYNIISDGNHAKGVVQNGALKLCVLEGFPMLVLNTPAVKEKLSEAAQAAGLSPRVEIEEGLPQAGKKEFSEKKIDKLMQFGNVKFE